MTFGEDAEADTISLELLETGLAFALEFVDSCTRRDLVLLEAVGSFRLRAPCFAEPPVQDPVGVLATLLLPC